MHYRSAVAPFLFLVLLGIATLLIWSVVFAQQGARELRVSFLDVGQGDAILIETPNGTQVLIDGGKGKAVLRELGRELSFFDRSIDIVFATHPDADHIGGLPEVFARYVIGLYYESGVEENQADAQALQQAVLAEGLSQEEARVGTVLALDEGIHLEVLFPDRSVADLDPNAGSIILHLSYGDTAFLFTGDAPKAIEQHVTSRYGTRLQADVLKLGHHGSKTSTAENFLAAVDPEYAVVSASCGNSYGHPHKEVVDRVLTYGAQLLETCKKGTITFVSDGVTVGVE